jgi:anti-anti-sigma factor
LTPQQFEQRSFAARLPPGGDDMDELFVEKVGPTEFKLAGELDLARAGDLDAFFERELPEWGDVTFDLEEVQFVDSAAIGVFARVAHGLEGRGRLILVSPTRAVRLALDTVRLEVRDNIEIRDGIP